MLAGVGVESNVYESVVRVRVEDMHFGCGGIESPIRVRGWGFGEGWD